MSVDWVRVDCRDCRRDLMVRPAVVQPQPDTPNTPVWIYCDDCLFGQMGDMMSINELRRLDLHTPDRLRERDRMIAKYVAAGIDPDQDPGIVYFSVPSRRVDESADDFARRVEVAAVDAWRLRRATPDDFATGGDG
jgi:hypothetical protein